MKKTVEVIVSGIVGLVIGVLLGPWITPPRLSCEPMFLTRPSDPDSLTVKVTNPSAGPARHVIADCSVNMQGPRVNIGDNHFRKVLGPIDQINGQTSFSCDAIEIGDSSMLDGANVTLTVSLEYRTWYGWKLQYGPRHWTATNVNGAWQWSPR